MPQLEMALRAVIKGVLPSRPGLHVEGGRTPSQPCSSASLTAVSEVRA